LALELFFRRQAVRDLRRLAVFERMRVLQRLDAIAHAPDEPHHDVLSVVGRTTGRRLRVGDWRVVFNVTATSLDVLRIEHRRENQR
jgi:mRNA-degrading endonuclease RelE of RelBE toxin-antitoxin system